MNERQHIPEDLAQMAPGPELGVLLASIDRTRLNGYDAVILLEARARQVAYDQAQLLADMVEIAHCPPGGQHARLGRRREPDEDAADEIAMALTLTQTTGQYWLHTALDLVERLPRVHTALQAGDIDLPRAKVFAELTSTLDDDVARAVVDKVLDHGTDATIRLLRQRLRRAVIRADPDAAAKRYREQVEDRRVEHGPCTDGTAVLSGVFLPPQRAAAASERLDAIARAAKAAGDTRTMDQLRADAFLDLLEGKNPGPAQARRGVVELTVPLTTLMGLDQEPGELAGWGPVVADIARQVTDQHKDAQWRFSVLDPRTGLVAHHGLTRRRPTAGLADWIAARDRRCRAPRCMLPAKVCQADHTIEYQHGGPTNEANLGPFCIRHHTLKSKHKVTVSQPRPGHFVWTTALGHTHHIGPQPPYD